MGYWKNVEEIQQQWQAEREFIPSGDATEVQKAMDGWNRAIKATQIFKGF